MLFDGSDVWVGGGNHPSVFGSAAVQRINAYSAQMSAWYTPTISGFGVWTPGAVVYAADKVYAFSADSSFSSEYIIMDQYDDGSSAAYDTLTATIDVRSGIYDGQRIWLGTSSGIYTLALTGFGGLTARQTGLGEIVDILYIDGYIWALDADNGLLYKVDPSTGSTVQSINAGASPVDMEYDGGVIWVSTQDALLTRITVGKSGGEVTDTIDLSATLTSGGPLTFDGVRLWVIDNDAEELYSYNIAQEELSTDPVALSGSDFNDIIFDGSYVWVSDGTYVDKIAVGARQGYSLPAYSHGIILYGDDDLYHCIYFDSSGTLQDGTGLTNCR
jgi:hypothetical protein